MSEELKAALARIACLEGEIAKLDARIAEVEGALLAEQMQAEDLSHELAAIKAQDTVGEVVGWYRLDRPYEMTSYPSVCATWHKLGAPVAPLYAAPAAPAADAWIPVGDRLPEVESRLDQECRAGTLSIAPLNVSAAVLVFDGEKVRSTRLEWFDGCLPLPYCITHWMPLPAAPAAHSSKGVV